MGSQTSQLRPVPKGKAATQERILAAATELFMERGYEKTTVSDVAERGSVSRATVFWHFSDKGGLFREAFSRVLAPFRESLERDFHEFPPAERLQAQLAMSGQFAQDHRAEIAAFVRWAIESPVFRDSVIATLLDLNQRFAGVLTQTLAEIEPASGDPKQLATGLMLAFDANLLLSIFDSENARFAERDAAIQALAKLISARSGD
ncbi:MAG: TetR/AcrR family transcriptional regulator [Deltaproteobacteria bacterium]|nr:TetR/AcrR family transcriptional regulator [Deltaproteobacteria bacterium]MBW2362271.1 TetR/AcrR family transcriptional regulator [Deltaproteobacteria bacterium]